MIPPENPIGNRFIQLDRIHSTNDLAFQQIAEGIGCHGDVIFAREQYAGRGQMGKSWHSEAGQNLAISLLLQHGKLPDPTPFHLSAWVAVSALDLLTDISAGDTAIKWPNDLYWKNRKLGGILIETRKEWTVAGLGININQTQFPDTLKNPVSLRQITGKSLDPKEPATQLIDRLNRRLSQWNEDGFESLLSEYRNALYGKGNAFTVREQGIEKTIRVIDVNESGALIIEENGQQRGVVSGLEWMIDP